MEAKMKFAPKRCKEISLNLINQATDLNRLCVFEVISQTMTAASNKVVVRADGLKVFLDKNDEELNQIRLNEPDARKVILAIALRRAQQIACSYARKHAPELVQDIVELTGGQYPPVLKEKLK